MGLLLMLKWFESTIWAKIWVIITLFRDTQNGRSISPLIIARGFVAAIANSCQDRAKEEARSFHVFLMDSWIHSMAGYLKASNIIMTEFLFITTAYPNKFASGWWANLLMLGQYGTAYMNWKNKCPSPTSV